jgi:hypothetical protein
MDKKLKDRWVGGLGGGGGALLLYSVIIYVVSPGARSFWSFTLSLGLVGAILLSLGIYAHTIKVDK